MARSSAPDALDTAFLHRRLAGIPPHQGLVVAFSGGPDSSALLHALTRLAPPCPLRALHVDHGLDPESGRRARAACQLAATMDIQCGLLRVQVESAGDGPEAAARKARYQALAGAMHAGEVLLTAHHADDQAETVLLRLLRGAGPAALAGMPALRRFQPGWLFRPLLPLSRASLDDYLRRHALQPVIDPSNARTRFDRNYLRHRVVPALADRWPGWREAVLCSARLAAEAAAAQTRLAAIDLETCLDPRSGTLDTHRLAGLDTPRQRALLRHWCHTRCVASPPAARMAVLLEQIRQSAPDRAPEIRWAGHRLRRHAGRLYLDRDQPPTPAWSVSWRPPRPLVLPHGLGQLVVAPAGHALPALLDGELTVSSRRPGDRIRLSADRPRQSLKELMRAHGMPTWQRNDLPCLRRRDRLLAAGDQWLDAALASQLEDTDTRLVWQRSRPEDGG